MIQLEGDGTTPAHTGHFEAPPQKAPTKSPEKDIARTNLFIDLKSMIAFLGGGITTANLHHHAVNIQLRTIAKRFKRFTPPAGRTGCAAVEPGAGQSGSDLQLF